jgi:hypothetical protein
MQNVYVSFKIIANTTITMNTKNSAPTVFAHAGFAKQIKSILTNQNGRSTVHRLYSASYIGDLERAVRHMHPEGVHAKQDDENKCAKGGGKKDRINPYVSQRNARSQEESGNPRNARGYNVHVANVAEIQVNLFLLFRSIVDWAINQSRSIA